MPASRPPVAMFGVGVGVVFAIRPLPRLTEYYADALARGETSGPLIDLVERANGMRQPDVPVLLDERLSTYGATYIGASSLVVAQYVLATSRAPHGLLVTNPVTAEWLSVASHPAIALLAV